MGEDVADPDRERATEPDFERELRDRVPTPFGMGTGVSGDWTIASVPDRISDPQGWVGRPDKG